MSGGERAERAAIIAAAMRLVDAERVYAGHLDCLLQTFWIPLVTQGIIDASQMPSVFGNVELIATAHVAILDRIDALGDETQFEAESEAALEHALAAVECVVDELTRADGDEAMLPLYTAYGRGLLKRLEAVDALCRASAGVAAFVDAHNAELGAEQHLKQLLTKPRQRVNDYYHGLRDLRRLLPKRAPLETRIRELLPLLRSLRETSDAVGADDIIPIKDDDLADAPPAPAPPTSSPPAPGPPPRLAPRILSQGATSVAAPSLGPPPPIVAGRGRLVQRDSLSATTASRSAIDKDKDKKASFTTRFGIGRKKDEPGAPGAPAAGAPPTSHKVFGVPLLELAARERRAVPIFVSVLCNIIEAKGLAIEGIFRTNESKPVESAARDKLERGDPPAQAAADPVVAASLIKMWLRELPDPLLTYAAYDKFITLSAALSDARATKLLLKQMIADLPAPHRACTQTLLDVCKLVVDNEAVNKMSAKNLAIVLGPNMLRPRADGGADHTKMVSEMQDAVSIVAAMIALHDRGGDSDTPSARSAAPPPSEPKLTGAPVVIGNSARVPPADEPTPHLPPDDPFEDLPPPPPEPADAPIDAPPSEPSAVAAVAAAGAAGAEEPTPPPHSVEDEVGPAPPAAQRGPLNMAQLQGAVRQRAIASEVARRTVAKPSSGGPAPVPTAPTRAPPPASAPLRRGPPPLQQPPVAADAPPAPSRTPLSPRGAAPASADDRIALLEASNAALVALTARMEERIAHLEQQVAALQQK